MKIFKKWVLPVILAVAAALLLELVQVGTTPPAVQQAATEETAAQETCIYPEMVTDISGYCLMKNELVTEAPDPQLYFALSGTGTVSYVYFHFNTPLENELRIQVFYPGEGGYSEANSTVVTCDPGAEFRALEIPAAEYGTLRIDIDGSPIPLDTIGVGTAAPGTVRQAAGFRVRRVAVAGVLLLAAWLWLRWFKVWPGMKNAVRGAVRGIREKGRKSILYAAAFPAAAGVSVLLFWLFCTVFAGKPMTSARVVFAVLAGLFAASLFVFRNTLRVKPEYLFLVLVLCIGFLYCWYVPHTGLNSWDEDVHYAQALKYSYVGTVVMTPQDEVTIARNIPASYDLSGGGVQALHAQQDVRYHSGGSEKQVGTMLTTIPEFFNGMGLFTGRALGLPYYMIHFLGRFFGLAVYAVLGFLAIRKLKSGKMIAAAVLLIPTEMFIASSYNYDCYLTGFTALGLCTYLSLWQDRQAKLTLKDAVVMIGSIAFGCLTKPIYIPLLWILVLLPRDRFPDKKTHAWWVGGLLGATGLIIFSYLLPSILQGTQNSFSDMRGGETVSAAGQLQYILQDPLAYVRLIWNYLIYDYFNLNRLGEMLTNTAYNGIMPNAYLYLAILCVAAVTDKNEYDRELVHHPWAHIWPMIVSLGVVILVITSMYLAFTPVGADYVSGAQFRYVIPMILPFLLHIGSGKVENRMDRAWYNGLMLAAMAYVGFATVYNGYICQYY